MKQLYQIGLYDNYDHMETYVVVAGSLEEAGSVAENIHLGIFPPEIYSGIEVSIESGFVIASVFGANAEYEIYLVEKPPAIREKFKRFIDLLKSGRKLDCELIVDNSDTSATFVWDEYCKITPYGEEIFKEILEAECDILPNGNIEIHSDNFDLGEYFVLAAAGYIPNSEHIKLFGETSE